MPSRRRPSKHAREHVPLAVGRIQGGSVREEWYAGGRWSVRAVTGSGATKPYLCPGCQQSIAAGLAHVVAWPAEGVGGLGDRRHWHTGCWVRRDARPSGNAYR